MPLFAYNRDIPDGPNNPSVDQPKMKVNTNSTDEIIDVDHYSFGEANGGLHRQVNLVNEASPLLQGNSVIYSNLNNGKAVPFAKNSTFDAPLFAGWQNGAVLSGSGFGYTSMFAGLIIQWGFVNAPLPPFFSNGDSGTVTFSTVSGTENVAFPTKCLGVWTSLGWDSSSMIPPINAASVPIDTNTLSSTSFTWIFNGSITGLGTTAINRFYYIAIGF